MKRVIITNRQLNEILIKENESVSIVNAVAQQNNLKSAITNPDTYKSVQNASTLGTDVDVRVTPQSGPGDTTIMLDNPQQTIAGATDAINKNPEAQTAIAKGYNVQMPVKSTNENKSFSKRQIEEARLEKIRKEGSIMTKKQLKEEWEEKPNDDASQWNDEFKMFMQGLKNGEQIEFGDNTIAVQIFKGRTSENDPRYVTFTKGDNRLQDDHFYIQHSPSLRASIIREIYSLVGWEPDENCEDYYPINEDEVDWNQRKQMRMDNFWDTLEYYIGLKDEKGGLNPKQLADAKDVCDKLSCFGSDAEEFCDYAREVLGLSQISESYNFIDNNDDITDGYDVESFISDFREMEDKYIKLPEDYELQDFYNRLLDDWTAISDEERSSAQSFKEYCNGIIADMLYEKYTENSINKK